jgi:hypothetical protein
MVRPSRGGNAWAIECKITPRRLLVQFAEYMRPRRRAVGRRIERHRFAMMSRSSCCYKLEAHFALTPLTLHPVPMSRGETFCVRSSNGLRRSLFVDERRSSSKYFCRLVRNGRFSRGTIRPRQERSSNLSFHYFIKHVVFFTHRIVLHLASHCDAPVRLVVRYSPHPIADATADDMEVEQQTSHAYPLSEQRHRHSTISRWPRQN